VKDALPASTLIDYFRFASDSGKDALLISKVDGEWVPLSAAEFGRRTRGFALGLALLGVDREDRVAILSENRPQWAIADFATLSLGALTVPIYTSYLAPQVEYILKDSLAKVIVVSNALELQKVLDVRERCPELKQIVLVEPLPWSAGKVASFETVVNKGDALLAVDPQAWEERAASVMPEDLATMIYTSGTSGEPKGAILTHANLVSAVSTCSTLFDVDQTMQALSFLPLAHVFERMVDYLFFSRAATIAYAESVDNLSESFLEAKPHCFAAVPRVYEKMLARVQTAVETAPAIRQRIFNWGVKVGGERMRAIQEGRTPGFLARLKISIADRLVFAKIRARLGGRFRFAISGGAPLAKEVAESFWSAGVEIYEGYGLTETSPVLTCNRPGELRLGTVGRPIPGVTLKIAPDGEVLAKGANVMEGGYWRKNDETARVFDADGWFYTGDIGSFDADGYLTLTDRKKEILVNAYGKNIAPAPIEAALRMVRYVSLVVLIGDRRKFLSALIVPNFEKLEAWALDNQIEYRSREDLIKMPRVRALFKQAIDILNGDEPH
jgi:long-chain acyl-CoA synthetase